MISLVHQYADALMYTELASSGCSVINCTYIVSVRFLESALLLNPGKTEAVMVSTGQRLSGIDNTSSITPAGSSVRFADAVKLLGGTLVFQPVCFQRRSDLHATRSYISGR